MTELNIFGDIAGNFLTLQALLAKMPKGAIPTSVGDMVDRGPRSKEVLEFFMAHGQAVMGNHEHMFIDYVTNRLQNKVAYYDDTIWQYNGGTATLKSYDPDESGYVDVPADTIEWLQRLPLFLKYEGLVITHGPIRGDFKLEQCLNPSYGFCREYQFEYIKTHPKMQDPNDCVLWHRGKARRKPGVLQVHGHNSGTQVEWRSDELGPFVVNLDTSRAKVLTGMHWPSLELFEQPYID